MGCGRFAHKTLRMGEVGGVEDGLSLSQYGDCLIEVHHGGRQHAKAGVAVLFVIPRKEDLAMSAAVKEATETGWEIRSVLERAELTFGERIVVGNVGAAMRLGDTEIGIEHRDGFGQHNSATVGVNGELPR